MIKNYRNLCLCGLLLISACSGSAKIQRVELPELRGYDRNQVVDVLREIGLSAKFVDEPNKAKEGIVIRTSPYVGTKVELGSTVEVVIASPLLHEVRVVYDVANNRWSNLPEGECEHRDGGVVEGQAVTLAGPDGSLLGSAFVSNGTVVEVGSNYWKEDYDGKVCRFKFTFLNIPEVATYQFSSYRDSFPVISLDRAISDNWVFVFGSF